MIAPNHRLPESLATALCDRGLLTRSDVVTLHGSGNEATCFLVRRAHPHGSLIIKLYHRSGLAGRVTDARAAAAFANMRAFSEGLADTPRVATPTPLALVAADGQSALVMSYVAGRSLMRRLFVARPAPAVVEQAGRDLVHGLRRYHETLGECYGETGPENFLLADDGTLFFIDPGYPNERLRRARDWERGVFLQASRADGMLASDLGGLLAGSAWWMARRPWQMRRLDRFVLVMAAVMRAASAEVADPELFARDAYFSATRRNGRVIHDLARPWHIPMRATALAVLVSTRGWWMPHGHGSARSALPR